MKQIDNKLELEENIPIMLMFIYGICLLFSLFSFIVGIYRFYKSKKILLDFLYLDLFENGNYYWGYAHKKYWLIYTKQCIHGSIDGFPVAVYVAMHASKYSSSTNLAVGFFLKRNNRSICEQIGFGIGDLGSFSLEIKDGILDKISKLKEKGAEIGVFDENLIGAI